MTSKRRRLLFAGIFILPWIFYWRCGRDVAAFVVYFLTLIVIAWYTDETHSLRLQQIRPYVLLIREGSQYKLMNAGNGAALNIRVSDERTGTGPTSLPWDIPAILTAGQERDPFPLGASLDSGSNPVALAVVEPDGFFNATFAYEDVEGKGYETCMQFNKEGNGWSGKVQWSKRK